MYSGRYKFAEKIIEINSIYSYVHERCVKYQTNETIDGKIEIHLNDIEYERRKAIERVEKNICHVSDEYLETLAIYRKLADFMLKYNTIVFHGSALAMDNYGIIFAARSGVGKSTHARLWKKMLGDKIRWINDDKPLIRIENNSVRAYGTPWDGKHHLSNNISSEIKSICFINRAETNSIEKMKICEVWPMVYQQCYCSSDSENVKRILELIDELVNNIRFYRINCNMKLEAAQVAYERIMRDLYED